MAALTGNTCTKEMQWCQKREISLEEKIKNGGFYMESEQLVHEISLRTELGKRKWGKRLVKNQLYLLVVFYMDT